MVYSVWLIEQTGGSNVLYFSLRCQTKNAPVRMRFSVNTYIIPLIFDFIFDGAYG